MIDAPAELADELRPFDYALHDLGRTLRSPLSKAPAVDFGLLALRLAFVRDIAPEDIDRLTGD